MHVGLFGSSLSSPDAGGGYTIEKEILEAISEYALESHHSFTLYSSYNRSLKNVYSVRPGLKSRGKSILKKIAKILHGDFKLYQSDSFCEMIKSQNPDVIFYLTPWAHFDVNIPYISIVWDLQHRLQPQFSEVSANGEFERREAIYSKILPKANVIITGTEAGKAEIERFYAISSERVKILPHPTPIWALEANKDENTKLFRKYNFNNNYLFYPAQFWSHKNHRNLVNALKILIFEYNCKFDLVFVGSDKGSKYDVEELVRISNLSEYVHFLGFVNRDELVDLYKSAFALTYVSLFGPENMPPLEAFALGCPVIAANVSGAEEQLADAAILVNGNNPREIADAIVQLKGNNELRNELISKGKLRALKWTAKDFVLGLFKVLDEFEKNIIS